MYVRSRAINRSRRVHVTKQHVLSHDRDYIINQMNTLKQLSNFSSPANLSPTPLSEYDGINTSTRYDDGTANAGYLILVPIAILVFIVITVLGTYKWQNRQEQSSPSLCQVLRRRVIRSCSPRQLRTQTNNSAGHIVTRCIHIYTIHYKRQHHRRL